MPDNEEVIIDEAEKPKEEEKQEAPPEEKKSVLSDIEKSAFESLSPEEREMVNDGEAKIVDGEFRVSLPAFKKRIGGLQSRVRETERKAEDLEAAINAVRQQRSQVMSTAPDDDGITEEQLQNLLDTGEVRRYGEIIAARTYKTLRQKEAQNEDSVYQQQTWAKLIADGDERAIKAFPQLSKSSDKYDQSFYDAVTREAQRKGYLKWDEKQKVNFYYNPAAYYLAALDVSEKGIVPKTETPIDTKKQADLDEVMRQKRMKQSEMEKGKTKPATAPVKLTPQQKSICEKFGISPEAYIKNLKKTEVTA